MRRALLPLLVLLGFAASCGGEDRIMTVPPPDFREDLFPQEAASRIDVLWVIDNSASMAPHQERLAAGLTRFMETFSRGLVDYRIAVTTADVFTDRGELKGNPPIISPQLPDPVAAFQRNVLVGTDGKGHEEAFEAARLVIERERARAAQVLADRKRCLEGCPTAGAAAQKCQDDCSARFAPEWMRPDAHLYLVFVSDEEEQSFGEIRAYQRLFEGALGVGNEGSVTVAAICGDVPAPPCDAEPGVRYAALARATGGIVGSICDASFEQNLERMALNAAGLRHKFPLSETPDLATLVVEVRYRCDTPEAALEGCESVQRACAGRGPEHRGVTCSPRQAPTDGWTYEAATNALLFEGKAVPGLRSLLAVRYREAKAVR